MELDDGVDVAGGPAGTRWNPTADQITLLEGLYKQGIRTPSAEQIQQITARLKVFGHIEGKNVFYWFQNHKARQRQKQKQKQENIAYFNRCYRMAAPVGYPSANFQNVFCSPYYLPTKELGLFQRYPTVLLQGGVANRPVLPSTTNYYNVEDSKQEKTLPLFPLEPTGVLQTRNSSTTPPSSSSEIDMQPNFFDFFAVNGSCESD